MYREFYELILHVSIYKGNYLENVITVNTNSIKLPCFVMKKGQWIPKGMKSSHCLSLVFTILLCNKLQIQFFFQNWWCYDIMLKSFHTLIYNVVYLTPSNITSSSIGVYSLQLKFDEWDNILVPWRPPSSRFPSNISKSVRVTIFEVEPCTKVLVISSVSLPLLNMYTRILKDLQF